MHFLAEKIEATKVKVRAMHWKDEANSWKVEVTRWKVEIMTKNNKVPTGRKANKISQCLQTLTFNVLARSKIKIKINDKKQ